MNIEIANRLVKLRKEKNLSQEALANELGISRQAVSKWERAEASPDTDNLILLAKLYEMSLDDLLDTDQKKFESENPLEDEKTNKNLSDDKDEYVHISVKDGIHIKEGDGEEVHIGWSGIHIKEKNHGNNEVHIDSDGVYVNGKKYCDEEWRKEWSEDWKEHHGFPISIIISMVYIFIGIVYNAWHPGWLIFGIIPLFETLASAIRHRDPMRFAYPVLILMIIGYFGFIDGIWYPYWLLLLTIPIYYSILGYLHHRVQQFRKKEENENTL